MAIEDHFEMTWHATPVAIEVGSLALDNSDPTFGDSGLSLGPDIYECSTCGAAVLRPGVHARWHDSTSSTS